MHLRSHGPRPVPMSWSALPPELLDIVLDNSRLLKRVDLARVALVCRAWRLPATRRLYRQLIVDQEKYRGEKAFFVPLDVLRKLASTLQNQAKLRHFVRALYVDIGDDLDTPASRHNIAHLITLCDLRELTLRIEQFDLLVQILPPAITSLTHLNIWLSSANQELLEALDCLPFCPALRSLSVEVDLPGHCGSTKISSSPSPLQLESLRIKCSSQPASGLIKYFTRGQSESSLKSLELNLHTEDSDPPRLMPLEHLTNLEVLRIQYDGWGTVDEIHGSASFAFVACAQLSQLSKATGLRRITLSLCCREAFPDETMRMDMARTFDAQALWNRFPPSVEDITIGGSVSTLAASHILTGDRFKHLKEFAFCLFTPVEREAQDLEHLERLARKRGVRLTRSHPWSEWSRRSD